MGGTRCPDGAPYREPAELELEFTDSELHLWDRVMIAAVSGRTPGYDLQWDRVDTMAIDIIRRRRKNFGRR